MKITLFNVMSLASLRPGKNRYSIVAVDRSQSPSREELGYVDSFDTALREVRKIQADHFDIYDDTRGYLIARVDPWLSENLRGGLAEHARPEDFDPAELRRGTEHEMEHTDDPKIATEIAMDHLFEDPDYYEKLERMESKSRPVSRSRRRRSS